MASVSSSPAVSGNPVDHCTVLESLKSGQKHYKCNYCGQDFKGTATRCYIHLTGDGSGVARCLEVEDAVITALKAAKAAKSAQQARKRKAAEDADEQRKRVRQASNVLHTYSSRTCPADSVLWRTTYYALRTAYYVLGIPGSLKQDAQPLQCLPGCSNDSCWPLPHAWCFISQRRTQARP